MKDLKHTPAPWYVLEYAGYHELHTLPFYGEPNILNVDDFGEQALPNAKLAAAAPDLLEALMLYVNSQAGPTDAYNRAIEAIRKATE